MGNNFPTETGGQPTAGERIKAVLSTLRHNPDVRFDLVAAAACGSLAGAATGEPGTAVVGMFLSQLVRPLVQEIRINQARGNAINMDSGSYTGGDTRFGVGILVNAFKTGKAQTPQLLQGQTDGRDQLQAKNSRQS